MLIIPRAHLLVDLPTSIFWLNYFTVSNYSGGALKAHFSKLPNIYYIKINWNRR